MEEFNLKLGGEADYRSISKDIKYEVYMKVDDIIGIDVEKYVDAENV